jgi:membrane protease YdiL (CAAX protease family)
VAITFTVFVLLHLGGWNLAHVFGVVLPLGAILTGLYLWRHNLPFVMLIHLVIDLPLFLIAIGVLSPL